MANLIDTLFGWMEGTDEIKAKREENRLASLAVMDAQKKLAEQALAENKFKLDTMKRAEEFKTTNGLDPALPHDKVGLIAMMMAQNQFAMPGPVRRENRMSDIMRDPAMSQYLLYGTDPGTVEAKSAQAELDRSKALKDTTIASMFGGGGAGVGASFNDPRATLAEDTAPAGYGAPPTSKVPSLTGFRKPTSIEEALSTQTGRLGLDALGLDPNKADQKITFRDNVKDPISGKFGQAAFDPTGKMVPGTFQEGKLDAQIQMVRQNDNSTRAVTVGGPNSPFPGHEIAVVNGKVIDKGPVIGAPELVKRTIRLADNSTIEAFVPLTTGIGTQTEPPEAAKQLGKDALNYLRPDGTPFKPTDTLADVAAAGGKKKEEMGKEKASMLSMVQIALQDVDELESRITNPDGTINTTEMIKMSPFGDLWHAAIPFTSGVGSLARWTNALEGTIRDESGAAIAGSEMSRLYQRYPFSHALDDATNKDSLARLRFSLKTKARTIDPEKASAWERANGLKGTKDGKPVLVIVDDGKQPKIMPTLAHFKDNNGKPIRDSATGIVFALQNGEIVRVR